MPFFPSVLGFSTLMHLVPVVKVLDINARFLRESLVGYKF